MTVKNRASDKPVNIGIIGVGYWGKNLVKTISNLGSLHTICDSSQKTLNEVSASYPGTTTTTRYQNLLSNPEIHGVVIATPAASHYPIAKEALLAGKDVFVEKPLALLVEEGEELVALAAKNKRILMVKY